MLPRLTLFAAAALALAGCATQRTAEVTRFHLNQPIPSDAISLAPIIGSAAFNLEYRAYADAVMRELAAVGFRPVGDDGRSAYEALLKVEQTTRPSGRERRSSVSFGFGLGGGGYRSGVGGGVGVGTTVPVGQARQDFVRVNLLSLQIKRRSDSTIVWEGRASEAINEREPGSALVDSVPRLARALLSGFPGPAGTTVRVPVK